MVRLEISPSRIEHVAIDAASDVEYAFDFATLTLLQPIVRRINRELRRQIEQIKRQDIATSAQLRQSAARDLRTYASA